MKVWGIVSTFLSWPLGRYLLWYAGLTWHFLILSMNYRKVLKWIENLFLCWPFRSGRGRLVLLPRDKEGLPNWSQEPLTYQHKKKPFTGKESPLNRWHSVNREGPITFCLGTFLLPSPTSTTTEARSNKDHRWQYHRCLEPLSISL